MGNAGLYLLSHVDNIPVWVWTILSCVKIGIFCHGVLPYFLVRTRFPLNTKNSLFFHFYCAQLDNKHYKRKKTVR
jgi:hypothetical protein